MVLVRHQIGEYRPCPYDRRLLLGSPSTRHLMARRSSGIPWLSCLPDALFRLYVLGPADCDCTSYLYIEFYMNSSAVSLMSTLHQTPAHCASRRVFASALVYEYLKQCNYQYTRKQHPPISLIKYSYNSYPKTNYSAGPSCISFSFAAARRRLSSLTRGLC